MTSTSAPFRAEIRLIHNCGSLLAKADVIGRTMKIFGFSLFRNKDRSGYFVSPPGRRFRERWFPIVEITDNATIDMIEKAVIEAYDAAAATQAANPPGNPGSGF